MSSGPSLLSAFLSQMDLIPAPWTEHSDPHCSLSPALPLAACPLLLRVSGPAGCLPCWELLPTLSSAAVLRLGGTEPLQRRHGWPSLLPVSSLMPSFSLSSAWYPLLCPSRVRPLVIVLSSVPRSSCSQLLRKRSHISMI